MRSVRLNRRLQETLHLGACPGRTKETGEKKTPDVLYSGGKMMSTTEALCVQLDNVCRELHEITNYRWRTRDCEHRVKGRALNG